MTSKIYFQHLRTELKRPTTVAYCTEDDGVYYHIAECGPKDQFCRKTGRDIASGRLNKAINNRHGYGVLMPEDINSHEEIRSLLIEDLK